MALRRCVAIALAAGMVVASTSETASARRRPARRAKRFEANKTFGIGLMVGAPSGLSGKYYYAGNKAFDFGLGGVRYYRHRDGFQLHVDHLWHPVSLASTRDFELPLYLGIGARLFDFDYGGVDDAVAVGLRAPIGIAFDLNNTPLDIFLEFALVADIFVNYKDDFGADLNGALGVRYYLN
jgi:hypothetical protein